MSKFIFCVSITKSSCRSYLHLSHQSDAACNRASVIVEVMCDVLWDIDDQRPQGVKVFTFMQSIEHNRFCYIDSTTLEHARKCLHSLRDACKVAVQGTRIAQTTMNTATRKVSEYILSQAISCAIARHEIESRAFLSTYPLRAVTVKHFPCQYRKLPMIPLDQPDVNRKANRPRIVSKAERV